MVLFALGIGPDNRPSPITEDFRTLSFTGRACRSRLRTRLRRGCPVGYRFLQARGAIVPSGQDGRDDGGRDRWVGRVRPGAPNTDRAIAISEAKRAVEILPISKDAITGPGVATNLAVVYAWTNDLNLSFQTFAPLTKMPFGINYSELKRDPLWDPLRNDPRFDKLLAELAPKD
jgi:hypothetical protein